MSTLESERVVVSAPMSFTGSQARLWNLRRYGDQLARVGWRLGAGQHPAVRVLLVLAVGWLLIVAGVAVYLAVVVAIPTAWVVIACWYLLFGLLLVPYRLVRRGSRKRRRDELRHRELLAAARRGDEGRAR